jgi:succinyl-CoA synthetase alpha subunit
MACGLICTSAHKSQAATQIAEANVRFVICNEHLGISHSSKDLMVTDGIEEIWSKFQTDHHIIIINPHQITMNINQSRACRICIIDVFSEKLKRTIQQHYTLVNVERAVNGINRYPGYCLKTEVTLHLKDMFSIYEN